MTTLMKSPYFIALAISIVSSFFTISSHAFTFDLLHRDLSPRSPSYDPTLTHTQRVARALSSQGSIDISADTTNGAYIMDYSIGTPPVQVSGSLSAGSDLIWLPCKTSTFDLTRSKTYSQIPCNTPRCNSLPATTCSKKYNTCQFSMTFASGSSTSGNFSTDTIKFGSGYSVANISFGCGTSNGISEGGVGLGKGRSSLVKQMGAKKFSYCLASLTSGGSGGKLNFGDRAVVVGAGAVSIPLITGASPSFYYAHLDSITVGNQNPLAFGGSILLELGSTVTMLHKVQYWSMISALKASMPLNIVTDEQFDLCYSKIKSFPSVALRFKGATGGVVTWKQEKVFAQVDTNKYCIAFRIAADGADAIYGSFAQTDFLVGFDLGANTVNFKPATCS